MQIRKSAQRWIAAMALVLAVLGALMVRVAILTPSTGLRILWILCAVLLALLVILLFRLIWLSQDREPNFFLYQRSSQKNISADELTFRQVNDKMSLYFSLNFDPEENLWIGNEWGRNDKFGVRGEYRALVAYKMLYNLTLADDAGKWQWFVQASSENVGAICTALARAGDRDLAGRIYRIKQEEEDVAHLRSLLMNNKAYLEKRMFGFVWRNLEWFYYL